VTLGVAVVLQSAAVLAAAGAGAAVLVLEDGRRRALAMLAALLASALGLAALVADAVGDEIAGRTGLALGAAAAGVLAAVAIGVLVHHRPGALGLLAVAALPFRVPLAIGEEAANLLVPLYLVIAGGAGAYAWRRLRRGEPDSGDGDRRLLRVRQALAIVVALYAVQSLYSTDVEAATKNVCFFYVPFAVLFVLLTRLSWSPQRLRWAFGLAVGLAFVCAGIAFVEYATGHLLILNPKVVAANELKSYFRVNSLFFDPNVYGRYVAVVMLVLAAALLWARRPQSVGLLAGALALLWAGLVLSLSQSSFAAMLVGLAVLAALRWGAIPVAAGAAVAALAAVAVLAFAPAGVGLDTSSEQSVNKATSGRLKLTEGAVRMARDRPVWGFGSGSFTERYRARERVWSPEIAASSHTIPLTITAEQGAIGLISYLLLLAAALALVFGGLRAAPAGAGRGAAVARVAVAAAFSALVVHSFAYAAFLEDPLVWTLLALAAALRLPEAGTRPS